MKNNEFVPKSEIRAASDTSGLGASQTVVEGVGSSISHELESSFDWGPFQKIPNVRKFKITIDDYDELFLKHGIKKRLPPTLKFEPYKNGRSIRYARYIIQRLRNTADSSVYWSLVSVLLRRSVVFYLMAVSKSFPRYHRELPLHLVMRWVFGAMSIAEKRSARLELKRIYIPKPNGKVRPLGVPTPVWRIYLTVLNWFIVERFMSAVPSWQHGFIPKRGTLTAWRQILREVVESKFIYEFDLKSFFDKVDVGRVMRHLSSSGVPVWLIDQIWGMSKLPVFTSHKPEKPKVETMVYVDPPVGTKSFDEFKAHILANMDKYPLGDVRGLGLIKKRLLMFEEDPALSLASLERDDFAHGVSETPTRPQGFPQGANISPFLSMLQLTLRGDPEFANLCMYADDGIFYSNRPFREWDVRIWCSQIGVELAFEKSKFIKANGVWSDSLQFLGLNYNGDLGELKSQTRSGKSLKFDKEGLLLDVEFLSLVEHKIDPETRSLSGISGGLDSYYTVYNDKGFAAEFVTITGARAYKASCEAVGGGSSQMRISRNYIDGSILVRDVDGLSTWERIAKSNIFGLLQARMYAGQWSSDNELQNFDYEYIHNSWGGTRGAKVCGGEMLTFANSTSFAFYDIAQLIRKSRTNRAMKRSYKRGEITLKQLNNWRVSVGFPSVSSYSLYMKRFV